ncbi:MAG: CAP domain-containing protein [Actinomycetota bacterium]|nr:CAP domain-containing protein [Actinomycetota bacterium]
MKRTSSFPATALSAALILTFAAILALSVPGCLFADSSTQDSLSREEDAALLEAELQSRIQYTRDNVTNLATMIHGLINDERVNRGLQVLQWDQDLAQIALFHSRDMAERGYFDHVSPAGKDFSDRYRDHGYNLETRVGDQVFMGGENLFQNNVIESYIFDQATQENLEYEFNDLEEIARSTVEGWMDSPGHRENILTPFSREGIGIYVSDDGAVYITENFS